MDRFAYERIQTQATYADPVPFVYRPVVPLTIHGWTKDFSTKRILDTGSAETILPLWVWKHGLVDPLFRDDEIGELQAANRTTFLVRYGTVDLSIRLKHK